MALPPPVSHAAGVPESATQAVTTPVPEPINRTSAEPYYLQLAARLRARIGDGSITMGSGCRARASLPGSGTSRGRPFERPCDCSKSKSAPQPIPPKPFHQSRPV